MSKTESVASDELSRGDRTHRIASTMKPLYEEAKKRSSFRLYKKAPGPFENSGYRHNSLRVYSTLLDLQSIVCHK